MSEPSVLRSPQVVAKELDVSPATLRRWSDEFKEFFSREAVTNIGRSHRRYNNSDLAVLHLIKELMNDGMTYEQVRDKLVENNPAAADADETLLPDIEAGFPFSPSTHEDENAAALMAPNGAESPALAFLTNTLATLSDSQKSVLNSQAANRELLGVLLQDNFNLKEENNRLRDRILEVEREVAQTRQDEEWRREALRQELDAKITASSQLALQAINLANSIEVPEIKTVESNPGCLGMLFGGGGSRQIVASRRKNPAAAAGIAPAEPSAPVPLSHPKPMFPPE